MADELKNYTGGCHCGAVKYEVKSAPIESAMECNCSHCSAKGFLLSFVPHEQFHLISGKDNLTRYHFNTHKIDHEFCKTCGVESFAHGADAEGNQMTMINIRCLQDVDVEQIARVPYNGKDA